MSEDEVRSRVDSMISKIRSAWAAVVIACCVYVIFSDLAWWYILIFWVGCIIGFNLHILLAGHLMVRAIISEGGINALGEVEVVAVSPLSVGRYYDFDVPEWIDIKNEDAVKRYMFKDFAVHVDGAFSLPTVEGSVLYKAGVFQPAQS